MLPLPTQARLLRVLQSGEFIKVGSSKVQKTNVRVVAATNIDLRRAIESGRFREDLYFRLNTVPIRMPALRDRKGDIHMLFRKFALDFASRYMMPAVRLTPDAVERLEGYGWPGNVRELKSVAERISVMETERTIDSHTLAKYLQNDLNVSLPALAGSAAADYMSDRDIIFKMIMQLKQDIENLKARLDSQGQAPSGGKFIPQHSNIIVESSEASEVHPYEHAGVEEQPVQEVYHEPEAPVEQDADQNLSINDKKSELIVKALEKHRGNRKEAAAELGISERTLYRKIKELGL